MKSVIFTLLSLGVLGSNAAIYVTSPVATSSCTGGKPCVLAWKDDGTAPASTLFGLSSVALYLGSTTSQVLIQDFGTLDPAKVLTTSPVIDPSTTANGNQFFIRFQSLTATDAAGHNLMAFSSMFPINDMTGQLTPAQVNAINGINNPGTVAPIVANSTATSSSPARTSITSGSKPASTSTSSGSSSASGSSKNDTSGASSIKVGLGALIGVAGIVALIA